MGLAAGLRPVPAPVRIDPELADEPGAAVRVGLIVIATDHTTERDVRRILPPSVDVLASRVPCRTVTTVETLGEMADDLTRAADLLLPGSDLHAIAFACTTGTIVIGEAEVAQRVGAVRPGIPVITPIAAALDACRTLGLRRLGVVLPYVEAVNRRVTARLAEAGVEPSVGSVGDSYDNALAETINGLYKAEVIHRRGPWRSMEHVELATLEWVSWFNTKRLLGPIGNIPPAEAEARYWAEIEDAAMAA